MLTLRDLQQQFPRESTTTAVTGQIPMDFVRAHIDEIREIVREHGLRRIYRGPRRDFTRCWTRRADARAMLLYRI